MRPCPLRPWHAAAAEPRTSSSRPPKRAPQETPELPAETVACVAPARPAAAALKAGPIYQHRFRDAKPINFGKALAEASSPSMASTCRAGRARSIGRSCAARVRISSTSKRPTAATTSIRCSGRTGAPPTQAGLKRGAYHFFYWCRTAGEQADWFIRNVPRVDGALPPVIDVEWNGESSCKRRPSRAKVLEKMQVFMDKLERHYGQRPIIYTSPDFYRDNLKGAFPDYPFWLRAVARASVKGLSRPQMGVLAVFRLRPRRTG